MKFTLRGSRGGLDRLHHVWPALRIAPIATRSNNHDGHLVSSNTTLESTNQLMASSATCEQAAPILQKVLHIPLLPAWTTDLGALVRSSRSNYLGVGTSPWSLDWTPIAWVPTFIPSICTNCTPVEMNTIWQWVVAQCIVSSADVMEVV